MRSSFNEQISMGASLCAMCCVLNDLNANLPVEEQGQWCVRIDKYSIDVMSFSGAELNVHYMKSIWREHDATSEKFAEVMEDLRAEQEVLERGLGKDTRD